MSYKSLFAAAVVAALPAVSHAADGLSGDAALGFLNTSGNTESRTLNGKVGLNYRDGKWGHFGYATALIGSKSKLTTDERYGLGYKATYDFTANDYAFGTLGYENDRFAGITERTTEAVGYGRRILTGPIHTLEAEIGAGLTQVKDRTGSKSNSAVAVFNGRYGWAITPTSSFKQTLKVEQSKDNTFVNPVSELKFVVAGNLFTTLGYEVRYNSDVPVGLRHTDTLTSVNLGYSFK